MEKRPERATMGLEVRKARLEEGTVTAESIRFRRPLDFILIEIDRTFNPSSKLARVYSTLIHRTHAILTRKAPLAPVGGLWFLTLTELTCTEATVLLITALLLATRRMTSSGATTCPIRLHIKQPVRRSQLWGSTNLSLAENRHKDIISGVPDAHRDENQHRVHGENDTGFNEHDDDGFVQSADSTHPHCGANVPGVKDEPNDDHEGEEDVERNRNR